MAAYIEGYTRLLQDTIGKKSVSLAKQLHAQILITGLDKVFATRIASVYAINHQMETACQLFDKIPSKDTFSCNMMIRGFANTALPQKALESYAHMLHLGIRPDGFTFPFVLKACASSVGLKMGKTFHGHILTLGLEGDAYVDNALIDMYCKCGSLELAEKVFNDMPTKNEISWNALIGGHAQNGCPQRAISLFHEMVKGNHKAGCVTALVALQACSYVESLDDGRRIHEILIENGLESDVSVANSLVNMYAKCKCILKARQAFDQIADRGDIVTWNSMITGYVYNGLYGEACNLFILMRYRNVRANHVTIVSLIPAIAELGNLDLGRGVHGYLMKINFESDVSIGNSLVTMYSKCQETDSAKLVFGQFLCKDTVSWNSMIVGLTQNECSNEALKLFHEMLVFGINKPNDVTMVAVVNACAKLAALQQGKCSHAYVIRFGLNSTVILETSLIDMYAKCGRIDVSRRIFERVPVKNVISWSALIGGYATHGLATEALNIFQEMVQGGVRPDHVTFTHVLHACNHAGLVQEGWRYYSEMKNVYGIVPKADHYAGMVDLLGRAGHLEAAQNFIKQMPLPPTANVWGALLAACRTHGNIELAEFAAQNLFEVEPRDAGNYVLLSNIYSAAGRWEDAAKVRKMIKSRNLKKIPGQSFIEVNNRVHCFVVGDRLHPEAKEIYDLLENLMVEMKAVGYVPDTNFVLHNVDDEEKENMLHSHSEKLAIAYGILKTMPGMPVHITKNLRVCGDCHTATKFISKITRRDIIVRDSNRFHHFRKGSCSCGDYW